MIIGEYGDRISDQTARGPDGGGRIDSRQRATVQIFGETVGLWDLVNSRRRVSFEGSSCGSS